jgi:gluconate 2-dehydrogenase alpha chain
VPIQLEPVDVAVVGLGAAGGVAVLPLARAGRTVAGIEAGTWMDPAKDYHADEIYNNVRGLVTTGNKVRGEIPTFRTAPDQVARQGTSHPMMNAIGGTSIHYHAQSWRFSPWDFQVRSRVIARYGANYIPAGSTVEDWPINYDDLEPFYDIVEKEIGVSGRAGNLRGTITGGGNVFEGPRQNEYPMPPLRDTGFTDLMMRAAQSLGWKPFRGPAAINSVPYQGRPACGYHGYCDRGGCHLNAKNSTAVSTIPAAQRTGNLKIFDMAHVTRIPVDSDGRVTGVLYLRDGEEYFQPAKAVLLGAYTYENVRLLLLSKSQRYPNGLSNNHGQVGRHYFSHQMGAVSALFPFDLNTWYGAIAQGVVVDEWADDNFDHAGLGFIGGASIHMYHERHPIAAAAMNTWGRAPLWGSAWKKFIYDYADRQTSAYIQCNTFPYENTYLDLDDAARDPLGDPVIRITSPNKQNEQRAAAYAGEKTQEWFRAAGAIDVSAAGGGFGGGASTHATGGTRMGDDPERNVVDRWGMSHEAANLGIVGGSVMGTIGARNPTLTVQALAWRTARYVAENWSKIAG